MKVGDLINELSQYDSELSVIFYREDEKLHYYEFDALDTTTAVEERLEDGTPYLNFKNMTGANKLLIKLTSDF
ncbi:MAG: hypothetical protein P8179_22895 [Candidatus Thiodiazotropha sp.]|jgi:hypothetical protein